MKKYILFTAISIVIVLSSCSDQQNIDYSSYSDEEIAQLESRPDQKSGYNRGQIKMNPIKNTQTGEVMGYYPMPENWSFNQTAKPGEVMFDLPGKGMVYGNAGMRFQYTSNRFAQRAMRGKDFAAPENIDQVIQNRLDPMYAKIGFRYSGKKRMDGYANFSANYQAQLHNITQSKFHCEAYEIEFKNQKDEKFFMVLLIDYTTIPAMFGTAENIQWGFLFNTVESNPEFYEEVRQDVLNCFNNKQANHEQLASYNARERGNLAENNRAFQSRMANNQRNFEASQRAYRSADNATASTGGSYKSPWDTDDSGTQSFIDAINEEENVSANGSTWKVDSGYDHYYMNQDNQYIGTNDHFYNPNMDNNVNNHQWTLTRRQ